MDNDNSNMKLSKKSGISVDVFNKIFSEGEQISENKPHRDDKAYISRLLSMISFPYKDTKKQEYERRDGDINVTMSLPSKWGTIPYGIYPRLLRIFIENEVRRTKSPIIYIGKTINKFFDLIGVSIGGKSVKVFKKQFIAYCNTAISFDTNNEKISLAIKNFIPVSGVVTFWDEKNPDLNSMFDGYIEITSEYYKFIMRYAMPIDLRIVKALKGYEMALDIFLWLNGRYFNLSGEAILIKKEDLKNQFGANFSRIRDFWKHFCDNAELCRSAFQGANFELKPDGILLYPSEPSIPKKDSSKTERSTLPF